MILHASKETLAPGIPLTVGALAAIDDETCLLYTGADWLGGLAVYIATIGVDFEVLEPPELVDEIRVLGERFRRAAG